MLYVQLEVIAKAAWFETTREGTSLWVFMMLLKCCFVYEWNRGTSWVPRYIYYVRYMMGRGGGLKMIVGVFICSFLKTTFST